MAVSTALRSELSGFLISCATSAAKLSMALILCHKASVISRSEPERSPISSPRPVKSGISSRARRPPPARALCRRGEPTNGTRDGAGEVEREEHGYQQRDAEDPQKLEA